MQACQIFLDLPERWKVEAMNTIRKRICGKSHIADIIIENSDLKSYEFKVTVCKYNTVKGWATIGYIRNDYVRNGSGWKMSFKPRTLKGEKQFAGRTGSYS